jgi:membrane-bound serine protease (ClpP class)
MTGAFDPAILAGALVAVIAFAAVKVAFGLLLWTKKSEHRIGDRFGDEPAEVIEWRGGEGVVLTGGERWRAVSKEKFSPGDQVRIARVKGLTLDIRKS